MKMMVTDLDGTLLRTDRQLDPRSVATLVALGERGVVRAIATGRSWFSARRVLTPDLPLDYLVFSSGAGVVDWQTGSLVRATHLAPHETERAARTLAALAVDFMVHEPIPDNHRFTYARHRHGSHNADFVRRVERYRSHCAPASGPWARQACQLIAVAPPAEADHTHQRIARALPDLTVVRTTSPIDHASCWIEVFPAPVSKSQTSAWVAARHQITPAEVVAVGNDTNDLDLLAWAGRSFVVANAVPAMRERHPMVPGCNDDGFSEAVARGFGPPHAP